MRVVVDYGTSHKPSVETLASRAAKLESEGFCDAEVEILKYKRLYGHRIIDFKGEERWAGGVENLRRRRKTLVKHLAREKGISVGAAAARFREQAEREIQKWDDEGKPELPDEYDAMVLMGYRKSIYERYA